LANGVKVKVNGIKANGVKVKANGVKVKVNGVKANGVKEVNGEETVLKNGDNVVVMDTKVQTVVKTVLHVKK